MEASPTGRRYGGRDASERAAERRERLLAAALEIVGIDGYRALTIRGLCTRAGLAPRYFYEQFADRETVLRTLYDETIAAVFVRVEAAREDGPDDPAERLLHLIGAFLEAMLADERRARVCYLEVPGASPAMEEHRRAVVRGFEAVIAGELRAIAGEGGGEEVDLGFATLAFAGATNELLQAWLLGERRPPREQLARELSALARATLATNW